MSTTVRIFGYSGTSQIQQAMVKQYSSDSMFVLVEPYEWSQVITLNGATPVSSSVVNPDRAQILKIEMQDSQSARYEMNPSGPLASNARLAGNASPRISGVDFIQWQAGASISFVDAASFP